jgi:hypothetical protein
MREDMMRKGVFGQGAANVMTEHDKLAREALLENRTLIGNQIGGTGQTAFGEGGSLAQRDLAAKYARLKGFVNNAYDQARATYAAIDATGVEDLVGRLEMKTLPYSKALPKNSPIENALNDLRSLMKQTKQVGDETIESTKDVTLKELEDWRRMVSKTAEASGDKSVRSGLREMVKEFDDNLKDIVHGYLKDGNEEAVTKWVRAIRLRRAQGFRFEDGDLIAKLVETTGEGGKGVRLAVDPAEAGNAIFGTSTSGLMSAPGLRRELARIRLMLGDDSVGWRAIKEEAFMRIAAKMGDLPDKLAGGTMQTAWLQMKKQNPEVIDVLFSRSEQELIDRFAATARRITQADPGGANPSNTTPAAAAIAKEVLSKSWAGSRIQAFLAQKAGGLWYLGEAMEATTRPLGTPAYSRGVLGVVGMEAGRTTTHKPSDYRRYSPR